MAKALGKAGLDLIKDFESLVLYVYDDLVPMRKINGKRQYPEWDGSKPKGTLTIGYGHTNAAAFPLKISQGLRITPQKALEVLSGDLGPCVADVNKLVKVDLTQNQFDALVSFQFNSNALKKASFLTQLNKGQLEAVPPGLMKFVMSKGKKLRGLVRRRTAEVALWNKA